MAPIDGDGQHVRHRGCHTAVSNPRQGAWRKITTILATEIFRHAARLTGANYQKVRRSEDPWLKALMENYETWLPLAPFIKPGTDPARLSTTLFDTVAVYAAHSEDLLIMEDLPVRVTDDGYTVIDERQGRMVRCATGWKDLPAFENELTQTLLGARL